MSAKNSKIEKLRSNNSINQPRAIEDNMFIGSVFCVDLPKLEQQSSIKNGALFGIEQF